MRKLYDKDLRRFFESARFLVSGTKSPGGGMLTAGSTAELASKKKGNQGGLLGKSNSQFIKCVYYSITSAELVIVKLSQSIFLSISISLSVSISLNLS